jgi:hypothetical protein
MRPLMSGQLAAVLGRAFEAPGLAGARTATKQVATATAGILAVRARSARPARRPWWRFRSASPARRGPAKQITNYAVITLTGTGSSWQVNDIELASAGNQ